MEGGSLSTVASVHSMLHTTAHQTTYKSMSSRGLSCVIMHRVPATAEVLSAHATTSKICWLCFRWVRLWQNSINTVGWNSSVFNLYKIKCVHNFVKKYDSPEINWWSLKFSADGDIVKATVYNPDDLQCGKQTVGKGRLRLYSRSEANKSRTVSFSLCLSLSASLSLSLLYISP